MARSAAEIPFQFVMLLVVGLIAYLILRSGGGEKPEQEVVVEEVVYEIEYPPDVVVDAGHGGGDGGTQGGGVVEKFWALEISILLKDELEGRGLRVAMTRYDDRTIDLDDRALYANELEARLFVSIHLNNASSDSVHGIETFYTWPKSRETETGVRRLIGVQEGAHLDDPGNRYLAREVQRRLIAATGARDRGVKAAGLAVTRNTIMPAILVECGFLSNDDERSRLGNARYRERLVSAIADGVVATLQAGTQEVLADDLLTESGY